MKKSSSTLLSLALAAIIALFAAQAQADGSVGVPNFDQLYAGKPELNVYPSYLRGQGLLIVKQSEQPAYEVFSTTGYTLNGPNSAMVDPSITKMQIESDIPGATYFGIFQLIDGQPFSIVKDMFTGEYWIHGVARGEYKSGVCAGYDRQSGLLSGCKVAPPRIKKEQIVNAVNIALSMAEKYVQTANESKGFDGSSRVNPAEKAEYIARQRQNYEQLR